ncbi:MAG: AAA family ATPase [Pseudomonadota bacterium]|nr:AAA family ATPase [Pseudomonadota bacterium]
MKLKMIKFRVQNYRNINDSSWITSENVTALVGCNESGKSALLKALHKFNPAVEEPYDAQTEFPRDRFAENYRDNGNKWPVCSVEFELTDDFKSELKKSMSHDKIPERVVATKYYDGSFSFEYIPDIPDDAIDTNELNKALDDFKKDAQKIKDDTDAIQETLTSLVNWVDERKEDIKGIQDLHRESGIALLEKIRNESDQYSQQGMADSVQDLQSKIDDLLTRARTEPLSKQLDGAIEDALPVFVYFDSYDLLNSSVHLPTFCQALANNPEEQSLRMSKAMFKQAELDAQEINELGSEETASGATDDALKSDQQRKALRFVNLNSASEKTSKRFNKWYGQRKHKFRYDADGNYFRVWVSDDRSTNRYVELEERSKGFQWFFSFYTIFSAEADDGHKNAILLLDEPGLHLHPTAQQELLSFFDKLAEKNPIIYTTHSQYLIDDKHIDRTYAVTVNESGYSSVSIDGWEKDIKAIFPIQSATMHSLMQELLQSKKNLLVEGATDKLYLQALSEHCKKDGKQGLPEGIYMTECDGATKVSFYVSIFLNHGVRPVVLLDSDKEGKKKEGTLVSASYAKHKDAVIMLGEVFSQKNYEIEDMIGEEIIISALGSIVGAKVELNQDNRNDNLVERIKNKGKDIELPKGWKHKVAQHITDRWSNIDTKDMPKEVLCRADELFKKIARCFNTIGQEVDAPATSTVDQDTTTISNKIAKGQATEKATLH